MVYKNVPSFWGILYGVFCIASYLRCRRRQFYPAGIRRFRYAAASARDRPRFSLVRCCCRTRSRRPLRRYRRSSVEASKRGAGWTGQRYDLRRILLQRNGEQPGRISKTPPHVAASVAQRQDEVAPGFARNWTWHSA